MAYAHYMHTMVIEQNYSTTSLCFRCAELRTIACNRPNHSFT